MTRWTPLHSDRRFNLLAKTRRCSLSRHDQAMVKEPGNTSRFYVAEGPPVQAPVLLGCAEHEGALASSPGSWALRDSKLPGVKEEPMTTQKPIRPCSDGVIR